MQHAQVHGSDVREAWAALSKPRQHPKSFSEAVAAKRAVGSRETQRCSPTVSTVTVQSAAGSIRPNANIGKEKYVFDNVDAEEKKVADEQNNETPAFSEQHDMPRPVDGAFGVLEEPETIVETTCKMLDASQDRNSKPLSEADSSLLVAAKSGNCDQVRQIVSNNKPNLDCSDRNGYSPLCLASKHNQVGCMKLLIDAKASLTCTFLLPVTLTLLEKEFDFPELSLRRSNHGARLHGAHTSSSRFARFRTIIDSCIHFSLSQLGTQRRLGYF